MDQLDQLIVYWSAGSAHCLWIVYGSAHCLWIGSSVIPKATGSDPPLGTTYCFGSIPRTSVQILYVEAHEPALTSHRLKLLVNFVKKLKPLHENPAYSRILNSEALKF